MLVLRILLLIHTYLGVVHVVQTAAGGTSSMWHLVETVKSTKGIPMKEDTGKNHGQDHGQDHGKDHGQDHRQDHGKDHGQDHRQDHGQDHRQDHGKDHGQDHRQDHRQDHGQDHRQDHGKDNGMEHGKNGQSHFKNGKISNSKKKNALGGDFDQSCSTSEDCYTECKLCDGYVPYGPENSFCLCQRGTCKKIDKENIAQDQRDYRSICIKNGECIDTDVNEDWQECNGKCIKNGSACGGQCPYEMCRKGNKCLLIYNSDYTEEVRKTCNGECIGVTETCDGKCEFDDCLMNDGSCLKIQRQGKSQIWKSCKGKCIKSSLKCDGSCSWGQCEMNDGTCTYTITEDDTNGYAEIFLKFGVCVGQCVEILTNTSTPACHGQCESIPGTERIELLKFEEGICHFKIYGPRDMNE